MVCQRSSGGSGSGFAQEGFELGEGLFDGIEVGGVGWHSARRLDGFTHALDLVSGAIVHDDDVAGSQARHQTGST